MYNTLINLKKNQNRSQLKLLERKRKLHATGIVIHFWMTPKTQIRKKIRLLKIYSICAKNYFQGIEDNVEGKYLQIKNQHRNKCR